MFTIILSDFNWIEMYLKYQSDCDLNNTVDSRLSVSKARFKRHILHALNQTLILVDLNEYVRLIWFKRRIVLPNKIAEREWRVLNFHSTNINY